MSIWYKYSQLIPREHPLGGNVCTCSYKHSQKIPSEHPFHGTCVHVHTITQPWTLNRFFDSLIRTITSSSKTPTESHRDSYDDVDDNLVGDESEDNVDCFHVTLRFTEVQPNNCEHNWKRETLLIIRLNPTMLQESCLYVSFNLNYIFRFHNANCNVSPTFCMSRLIINSNGLLFLQLLMLSFYLWWTLWWNAFPSHLNVIFIPV